MKELPLEAYFSKLHNNIKKSGREVEKFKINFFGEND
jgi:hypothetical protein